MTSATHLIRRLPPIALALAAALALAMAISFGIANAQDETPEDAVEETAPADEAAEPAAEAEDPPPALPVAELPDVLAARVTSTAERARLVLDLGAETAFATLTLDDPQRIAVDVRVAGLDSSAAGETVGEGDGLVSAYEISQVAPDRVRTILVLTAPAQVQQAYALDAFDDQPARLVVDLVPATAEAFAASVAADLERGRGTATELAAQDSTEPGQSNIASSTRPLVVIDPGHGGIDSGAEGPGGLREKDIVLAFSLELQNILVESGRFDVALTREDDSYLLLEERVALARQNRADMFISIHADSFGQPEIRGASLYMRDDRATDVLDKVLAEEENKVDIIAGFAVPQGSTMAPQVVDILVDLMRREMRVQSFMAAQAIVHALEPSVQLRRFPVRQADFFVLQAPDVPSVLVELGFMSNPSDVANLQQSEWRRRTAEAIARGIAGYFDQVAETE
jgi:N-acetylmuramoyl-L-alanine amidase